MLGGIHQLGRNLLRLDPLGNLLIVTVAELGSHTLELLGLRLELGKGERTHFTFHSPQRDALTKNVDAQNFLLAELRRDDLAFLRKSLAALHIKLMLVAKAAHQPPASAGDLGWIEREALIFGD